MKRVSLLISAIALQTACAFILAPRAAANAKHAIMCNAAGSGDESELRREVMAKLAASDMPDELKRKFRDMANEPNALREMATDLDHLGTGSSNADADDVSSEKTISEMKVSEVKAELRMRGIGFEGVFEKSELLRLLERARALGKADPTILDTFNKQNLEARVEPDLKKAIDEMASNPEMLNSVKAADGSLPGSMDPEMLQNLMKNPDVMIMLQNPKMQTVMKAVMQEGPSAMAKFADDREAMDMLTKLTGLLQK